MFSIIEGKREAERHAEMLSIGIEARMLEVHCGDAGAAFALDLRRRAAGIDVDDTSAEDIAAEFDLDPAGAVSSRIIDEAERAEAERWYSEHDRSAASVDEEVQ